MYKTDATTNDMYTYVEFNEKSENLFESEKEHSGNVVNPRGHLWSLKQVEKITLIIN